MEQGRGEGLQGETGGLRARRVEQGRGVGFQHATIYGKIAEIGTRDSSECISRWSCACNRLPIQQPTTVLFEGSVTSLIRLRLQGLHSVHASIVLSEEVYEKD